jgi:hypothetical protein
VGFWNQAAEDATNAASDDGSAAIAGTYTPAGGSPVTIRCFVEERQSLIQGGPNGVTSQRLALISIPTSQVAVPQRSAAIVFASGAYAGTWSVQYPEIRTDAMSHLVCRHEKILAAGGDGARKVL